MNLPNAITVGRIVVTPFVAWLAFVPTWPARLAGFLLFLVAAISDGVDGKLARSRKQETDLGRLLDPFADKLLLLATFVPMWLLGGTYGVSPFDVPGAQVAQLATVPCDSGTLAPRTCLPFVTPLGLVAFPLWIAIVILGREAFMTVFRQFALRRGAVIAAIGPAKWKTGFQSTWQGAAFAWFFWATLQYRYGLWGGPWKAVANILGLIGLVTMIVALALTLYSLWLYLRRYGRVVFGRA